jgi:hypothetical protein
MPTAANLARARSALACVVNQQRARRGLEPLRQNARLRRAAAGHSAQMVHDGYYAHDSANGQGFARRIVAHRYVSRRDDYVLGENLAWSAGELSTGTWINQPSSYRFRWQRLGPHGWKDGYTPRTADLGRQLRATVVAVNPDGMAASTSPQTPPVSAIAVGRGGRAVHQRR